MTLRGIQEAGARSQEPGTRRQNHKSLSEALGKLGSVEAIPGLLHALEDQDSFVHGSAAYSLGTIRSSEILAKLWKQQLTSPDTNLYWAISAIQTRRNFSDNKPKVS